MHPVRHTDVPLLWNEVGFYRATHMQRVYSAVYVMTWLVYHKPMFCQNFSTDPAGFQHRSYSRFVLHCFVEEFKYVQK